LLKCIPHFKVNVGTVLAQYLLQSFSSTYLQNFSFKGQYRTLNQFTENSDLIVLL